MSIKIKGFEKALTTIDINQLTYQPFLFVWALFKKNLN